MVNNLYSGFYGGKGDPMLLTQIIYLHHNNNNMQGKWQENHTVTRIFCFKPKQNSMHTQERNYTQSKFVRIVPILSKITKARRKELLFRQQELITKNKYGQR